MTLELQGQKASRGACVLWVRPLGDQLPSERELMRLFGVGRPAIREALRWAVNKAGNKYAFTEQTSGNRVWDESMGASERHRLLLDILLGEGDDTPAWERRRSTRRHAPRDRGPRRRPRPCTA